MRSQIWVTLSYRTLVLHEEEEIDSQTLPSSQAAWRTISDDQSLGDQYV